MELNCVSRHSSANRKTNPTIVPSSPERRKPRMHPSHKQIHFIFSAAIGAFLCFSLLLTTRPAISVSAALTASTSTPVKVGMLEDDADAQTKQPNESVTFQKDYIQAVAEYADWTVTYEVDTWANLLSRTQSGDIDILLDVSKTSARETYFNFSSEEMGTEMACLYGQKNTRFHYDDFTAFNGIKIGYENGSTVVDAFQEYANENSFSFTRIPYDGGVAMFEALNKGEVDAVVQTNFYDVSSYGAVLLSQCKPSPVYIVTNKSRTDLQNQLDNAMGLLFRYNPGFNTDLFRYHFANAASQETAYTQEELDYLKNQPPVAFYYEENWAPFEYVENNDAHGISPDVIRAIGEETKINFQFVLFSSTQGVYKGIGNSSDAAMAVSYNYSWANTHGLVVTQPYVSGTTMQVRKSSTSSPKNVAVVESGYLAAQISKKYPTLIQVPYLTFNECMNAVKSGAADCTFLNFYQANYFRSMSAYEDFVFQPSDAIIQSIGIGVTTSSNPILLRILSKSLQHLSSTTLQSILSNNSLFSEPLTFNALMRRYPVAMRLGIGTLALLLGFLLFFCISSSLRKRQAKALEEAKKEAEQASKAKSEFLSRMSHDIRTPLNGIIGMTYLAEEKNTDPDVKENLAKIDISSKYLLSLINDILDMSKAESGEISLHPAPYSQKDTDDYVKAVIVPLCQEKKLEFIPNYEFPKDQLPLLDKLRMNQILFNLLSNAVKFTPEGGKVTLLFSVKNQANQKAAILIEVKDNGIGMSPEFQKVLFNPFTQEERNDLITPHQGTGLGMAITKKLIERMGGTIEVQSQIGEGTLFSIHLVTESVPVVIAASEASERQEKSEAISFKGEKILLFEDNAINQEIARRLLEEKGARVVIAGDGLLGVDLFKKSEEGEFAAILMDIRMPNQDGYESTRALRSLERKDAKTIPIIAMTADAFQDDIEKAKQAGMDAHLSKPINPQDLYDTLSRFLAPKKPE